MSKSKDEEEREYYNRELIQEGFAEEMKKPFSMKAFFADVIPTILGLFFGFCLLDLIGPENRIPVRIVSIIFEVAILAAMIGVFRMIFFIIQKTMSKSD